MERIIMIALLVVRLDQGQGEASGDKWLWHAPQEPMPHFLRRHQDMPIKSPPVKCDCPPYKECIIDYKINEAIADFLHIRGVIKDEELKEYKKDIAVETTISLPDKYKNRRLNSVPEDGECCCPPRSLLMPTFITEKKFQKTIEKLEKKGDYI